MSQQNRDIQQERIKQYLTEEKMFKRADRKEDYSLSRSIREISVKNVKKGFLAIFNMSTWGKAVQVIRKGGKAARKACTNAVKKWMVVLSLGRAATWKNLVIGLWKFIKMFFSNKKATAGTIIMLFFVLMALFGRLIIPYDPITDENNKYLPPSTEHLLGTDNLGRDVLGQLVYGSRDVLTIALLTSLITVFIGTSIGMLSGLAGGVIDNIIQIITNLFLSIPSFPVLLIFASFFTIEDPFSFAMVLSIWGWAGLSRAVRAQIVSLRERDFIQICKVMNLSKSHIIFKEMFPNIATYILINFIVIMRNAITGSVGIMMMGLADFQPSNWGAMLLRAKDTGAILIPEATYFLFAPIVAIMIFQMGAILLANGLDETLNPRLRED